MQLLKNNLTFFKVLGFYLLLVVAYCIYFFGNYRLYFSDDLPYLSVGYFMQFPYTDTYIGPVFPLFLKIWLSIIENPIQAYQFAILFLNIAIFSLIFGIVYKHRKQLNSINFLLFIFVCFSPFLFNILPKISFFCSALVFVGLYILPQKTKSQQFYLLLYLSFLLAYSRPEFFLSFLCIGFLGIYIHLKQKSNAILYGAVFIGLLLFGIFFLGGTPLGSRSLDAFKQHFILNYQLWNPQLQFPKYPNSEFELFDKVFGKINSLPEILIVNPAYFVKHVLQNMLNVGHTFSQFLSSTLKYFLGFWGINKYVLLIFMIALLSLISLKKSIENIKENFKSWIPTFIIPYLLLLFPTFISIFIIYPRDHYLLFHLYFLLFLLSLVASCIVFKSNKIEKGLTLLLFIFMISFAQRLYVNQVESNPSQDLTSAFKKVQSYGKGGNKTFYCFNLYDGIFFRNYFINHNDLNRSFEHLKILKPDVIYFRDLEDEQSKLFLKLPILKGYQVDSNFVSNKIRIFVKNDVTSNPIIQ